MQFNSFQNMLDQERKCFELSKYLLIYTMDIFKVGQVFESDRFVLIYVEK